MFCFYFNVHCQELTDIEEMDRNLNRPPPDLPLLHHLKLSLLRQRLVKFKSGKMAATAAVGAAALPPASTSSSRERVSPELPSAERNNQ